MHANACPAERSAKPLTDPNTQLGTTAPASPTNTGLMQTPGQTDSANHGHPQSLHGAPVDAAPKNGLHILLVEGMALLQNAVAMCLAHLGQRDVTCTTTGHEGLLAALQDNYDAILCALRPPGIDGMTMYERLRERRPVQAQRMVLLVSSTTNPAEETFLAQTELPILTKPFLPRDLQAIVTQALLRTTQPSGVPLAAPFRANTSTTPPPLEGFATAAYPQNWDIHRFPVAT